MSRSCPFCWFLTRLPEQCVSDRGRRPGDVVAGEVDGIRDPAAVGVDGDNGSRLAYYEDRDDAVAGGGVEAGRVEVVVVCDPRGQAGVGWVRDEPTAEFGLNIEGDVAAAGDCHGRVPLLAEKGGGYGCGRGGDVLAAEADFVGDESDVDGVTDNAGGLFVGDVDSDNGFCVGGEGEGVQGAAPIGDPCGHVGVGGVGGEGRAECVDQLVAEGVGWGRCCHTHIIHQFVTDCQEVSGENRG